MTRGTTAQVVVVGLIGERGREVLNLLEEILAEDGRKRSHCGCCPADSSPLMRLKGCQTALTAEYFRDQGLDVLLLMDSLTRFAWLSVKSHYLLASRQQPKVIRHRYLLSCQRWLSVRVTARWARFNHRFLYRTNRRWWFTRPNRRCLTSDSRWSRCVVTWNGMRVIILWLTLRSPSAVWCLKSPPKNMCWCRKR